MHFITLFNSKIRERGGRDVFFEKQIVRIKLFYKKYKLTKNYYFCVYVYKLAMDIFLCDKAKMSPHSGLISTKVMARFKKNELGLGKDMR